MVSFLKKYQSTLLKRPLVVGTLTGSSSFSSQIARLRRARPDLVEVRLDTFPFIRRKNSHASAASLKLILALRRVVKIPLLLTLRSYSEAGEKRQSSRRLTDSERLALIKFLLPLVHMIDIEIRSSLVRDLTRAAHKQGVSVIHSAHNFKNRGNFSEMTKLCEKSRQLKGDIFKVAVMPRTVDELDEFLRWGKNLKHPRKALIAMGAVGEISRTIGFTFGSMLTFGHVGTTTAPGQPSAGELMTSIRALYAEGN